MSVGMSHVTYPANLAWWLNKQVYKQCFDLFGVLKDGQGLVVAVMEPIALKTLSKEESQQGASYTAPVLSLTKESCQSLMDELWAQGIRPSNGDGNVGQLAATQAHLEDLRKITFDLMELKK